MKNSYESDINSYGSSFEALASGLNARRQQDHARLLNSLELPPIPFIQVRTFSQSSLYKYAAEMSANIPLTVGGNCFGMVLMHTSMHMANSSFTIDNFVKVLNKPADDPGKIELLQNIALMQTGWDLGFKHKITNLFEEEKFSDIIPSSLFMNKKHFGFEMSGSEVTLGHIISISKDGDNNFTIFDPNHGEISNLSDGETLYCLKILQNSTSFYNKTYTLHFLKDIENLIDGGIYKIITSTSTFGIYSYFLAIEERNVILAKLLVEKGINVNKVDQFGFTPLYLAIFEGGIELVKLLIGKGADVNQADTIGRTPLYRAASAGLVDLTKLLIGSGADVNQADYDGWTPLTVAVLDGKYETAKILMENGADIKSANKGRNLLEEAIIIGEIELMRLLVEAGAGINEAFGDGTTPVVRAVCSERSGIVKLLLDYQVDLYKPVRGNLNSLDLIKKYCPRKLHMLQQAQKELSDNLENLKLVDHNSQNGFDLPISLVKDIVHHDDL